MAAVFVGLVLAARAFLEGGQGEGSLIHSKTKRTFVVLRGGPKQ